MDFSRQKYQKTITKAFESLCNIKVFHTPEKPSMGRYEYEQEMRRRAYNHEMARRNAIAQEREMAFRAEMQRRQHMEQEHRRRMAMQQHNQQMQMRYGPPRDAVDDGCCGCCMM